MDVDDYAAIFLCYYDYGFLHKKWMGNWEVLMVDWWGKTKKFINVEDSICWWDREPSLGLSHTQRELGKISIYGKAGFLVLEGDIEMGRSYMTVVWFTIEN